MNKDSNLEILHSKTPKIYKNKKLNTANFGNFTLNDYQVFLHLISKMGGVDKFGKYLQSEHLQREHILTAKEFSEIFQVDIHTCYGILKKAVDKLMKTDIKVENIDLKEEWRINVCSMAKYSKGEGYISIKFTDDIMPYLTQVKEKFILYNLKEIANFGSLYTTRLYELIQEFKETGWLLKSVDQLREIFAVGSKFKAYKDFKVKTFGHACEEINNNFNINLKFEEIKEGRKVVAIRFSFNSIKDKSVIVQESVSLSANTKSANKIKISRKKELEQLEFSTISNKNLKSSTSNKEPKNIKSILSSLFSKINFF